MDKLQFKISKNLLSISIVTKDTAKEDLNNTNVIDTKNMVFSKDYILENLDLVSSFLNVVIIKREITKVSVKDYSIILLVIKIINNIASIEELYLRPEQSINYNIFLSLLENKTLKKLDVYDIPIYLLERLDTNKDLIINVRSEIFFISAFMETNDLNTYSDLYYKKNIIIKDDFDKNDYEDLNTFLNINHHLKTISIIKFSHDLFKFITELLIDINKKDIKIIIEEKNNDLSLIYKSIDKLKIHYEKQFRNYDILIKINYSYEFKKNNLFKQINLNLMKISLSSLILLAFVLMGINHYKNYAQERDIRRIEQELRTIVSKIDKEYDLDDQDTDIDFIEPDGSEVLTTSTPKSNYVSSYYKNYDKAFETLLNINEDTKGWLILNNTRIDYPVVQASDNDFYLKKDFNKYKNSMGWIFMDYRNSIDNLNQNTIIYGHNINGGIMFGTLRNALKSSWYTNEVNQVITFNTLNSTMKWQIISIYQIANTTDYYQTTFYKVKEYQEFLDLIVGRSIHNFNQELTTDNKILTLSTCHNRGQDRLVVHAKLIVE